MLKRHLSMVGLAVLAAFTSGCGTKETAGTTAARGDGAAQVLRIGNGAEPQDLDPQITTGVPEHTIQKALFEGLLAENPKDLSPEPAAAESF